MQHILITGCSTGIGEFCLKALSKDENYKVYGTCKTQKDVERFQKEGIWCCKLDVRDSESIKEGLEKVLDASGGRLDILFNNAGYGQAGAVEDLSREVITEQFETNVFGPMELTNLVMKIFRKQGSGKVIFNSSVLGFASMAFRGAYNASKFALEGFADALRLETVGSDIYVSLIEPGPIRTNFRATALKKLRENIDMENSFHKNTYEQSLQRLSSQKGDAPFTLDSDAVYENLLKAIKSPTPKARYQVTWATILLWYLKKALPIWAFDKILLKAGK
ncbi:MAG: SDR family NAD(P)-dependent oxidoreductase [Campylobacteraceae bacterium]|nr:SDR family NAD(P)-dependent oxidoreductase [Campylobacteraceae bacterium]